MCFNDLVSAVVLPVLRAPVFFVTCLPAGRHEEHKGINKEHKMSFSLRYRDS